MFRSALCLAVLAGPVSAATLDFTDACGGPCTDTAEISQAYGDIAGQLDITYDGDPIFPGDQPLFWWGTGYAALQGVAYSQGSQLGLSILFDAAPGFGVILQSFDIASFQQRIRSTSVRITDVGTGSVLFDTGLFQPTPQVVASFAGTWSSDDALLLEFGPDAWDVGIDNIAYATYRLGTAPVPLPPAGLLLIAALGALWGRRRLRQ